MSRPYSEYAPEYDGRLSLLEVLKLYHKFAIATAVFVFCWVLVYALLVHHNQYSSTALVLVKDSAVTNRYVVQDQNYAIQTTSSSASNPVLNTMGLLRSANISEAIWQYFKMSQPEELRRLKINNQDDWRTFYGDGKSILKAKNQAATDMIAIQFVWENPKIAKEALDVALKAFQETSLTLNRVEQENRSQYLEVRLKEIEKQLEDVRQKKSQYREEVDAVNLTKEGENLTSSGIELASRLNQVQATARGKEAEFMRLEKLLGISSENAIVASALGQNATLNQLHDKLYQLSQTYAQLKTTYTEKNPKLQEVDAQIQAVKASIAQEMSRTLRLTKNTKNTIAINDGARSTIINNMVSAKVESIRLYTESEVLNGRLTQINQQMRQLPTKEETLSNLEDKEKSLSTALANLRQKEIEAQLKQAETLSNIFVVDSPQVPKSLKFPTQFHILILGFGFSLVMGAIAAYSKYQLTAAPKSDYVLYILPEEHATAKHSKSQAQPTPQGFSAPPQDDPIPEPVSISETPQAVYETLPVDNNATLSEFFGNESAVSKSENTPVEIPKEAFAHLDLDDLMERANTTPHFEPPTPEDPEYRLPDIISETASNVSPEVSVMYEEAPFATQEVVPIENNDAQQQALKKRVLDAFKKA